ncbi:aspartate aminotransferase family protein [Bradyrhizobium canariense]|uniref:aspartate aminotransferase family protein n=1 Tax=Bradyrhizobium TaxID=374 RepID=UPI000A18C15C|nr:aspartate aminotransferase family protein [Bradyrhizobium canariense]OSI30539.1 aspartate aminotransferase family protein [Bradyrhizobium canariense]OSI37300.1 aspartate aminotransferase family protein [Bradyrhizobium canariense]OSI52020.1 aspartate aminotransferase family protein [Bradyrhizobium canariense]OSI56323.1 aspartate aminotransferase family protein [Bradyrhizobium canariense]OSI59395.1 aspartate aminotransferase family protein [Bradyrhizobium canariense]
MTLSNSLATMDVATSLHPYTDARAFEATGPLIMDRGDGIYVYDSSGKQYIEALAGLWSVAVGFSEKRLLSAAMQQMEKLPYYHIFAGKSHEPSIRLSDKLVEIADDQRLSRVFYTNSGSEANDTIIKLVWFMNNALGRPQKKTFLARNKAYHGITIGAGSLTGLPNNHRDFDLPAIPVVHLTCPHYYRFGIDGESEAEFTQRLLVEAEHTILQKGPETIAAFIGEPVMAAGGVLLPPEGYWPGIEALCRKYDILLVADEVITGFGRLGTSFGYKKFGFSPDIVTVSKQITSSYMPLGAVLFGERIYNAVADNSHKIGTFGHGYTGSAHPVATAVALENLKIIEERDLIGNAAKLQDQFQDRLSQLAELPFVGEVRGVGLICAVELVADKASKRPFSKPGRVGTLAMQIGHEQGLIFRSIGDTLALCPPLIVTEDQISEIVARMHRVLTLTVAQIKALGID